MIAGMLVALGVAVICFTLGHVSGYLMGVKVRNAAALFARPDETRDCLCGHRIVGHRIDKHGKRANCVTAPPGNPFGECACRGYVAKPETPAKGLLEL